MIMKKGAEENDSTFMMTGYILAVVWSAGMAALAVYSLLRLCLLRCRLRTAKAAGNLSWYLDEGLPASIKEVEVWRVKNLETAFVLGILRPRVYVPEELSSETEQYILVHEMIHVRRRDSFWSFLGFLALWMSRCIMWSRWAGQGLCWKAEKAEM